MEYLDGRETYLIKYYKDKLYTTEERENILLSILDENKRRINSRKSHNGKTRTNKGRRKNSREKNKEN